MAVARGLLTATLVMALIGVILIAIALGTDNWVAYNVDESNLGTTGDSPISEHSRSYGFFRQCFTGEKKPTRIPNPERAFVGEPAEWEVKKTPHGTKCTKSFPGFKFLNKDIANKRTQEYISLKITYIVLYSVGLFLAVLGLLFLLIGIGLKKGVPVLFTGMIFLLAAIFLAAAVGVWHKSNDQLEEINNFTKDSANAQGTNWYSKSNWGADDARRDTVADATVKKFSWSYYINWIGIGLIFFAALLSCCLVMAVNKERRVAKMRKFHEQGMQMPGMQAGQYATGDKGGQMPYDPNMGYSNYGYYPQQQQYSYADYMGYYNPFGTMQGR